MSENETENGTPVSDTLLVMTATSLDNSDLSPRELMIARIAALVALDASAASYALNAIPATDSGITLDDVEDILVAVAPVVGASTRVPRLCTRHILRVAPSGARHPRGR